MVLLNIDLHPYLVIYLVEIKEWDTISGNKWAKHDLLVIPGMLSYPILNHSILLPSVMVSDSS